jgi:hypothetical protein
MHISFISSNLNIEFDILKTIAAERKFSLLILFVESFIYFCFDDLFYLFV